jgi:hypothetical protein
LRLISVFALGVGLCLPAAAWAGSPMQIKERCAVGGQRFTYVTTGSYTIYGHRPDGRPYGSWTFPLNLPTCPKNGLVMYRDFSPDERARLPALLASPDYLALRKEETQYYRAAWLERALGGSEATAAWLLLNATWETDKEAARHGRYQSEFVTAAARAPRQPESLDWLALQIRAINALREQGKFEQATTTLKDLPRQSLDPRPAPPPSNPEGKPVDDEESRAYWRDFISKLDGVIARRDSGKEPLDLLPVDLAAQLCAGASLDEDAPPRTDVLCGQSPIVEAVAKLKAEMAANN